MTTDTEAYYAARATEYDRVYTKPERQADLSWLRRWLPQQLGGRHVLEVAAGTGYWTDAVAEAAASVTATDINSATLAVAQRRRPWPPTVRFVLADAFDLTSLRPEATRSHNLASARLGSELEAELETEPARFDGALVGFLWSHVDLGHLPELLAGLAAALAPGAAAVFMDNRYVEGSNHPIVRQDQAGNTYQRRRLDDGTLWEVRKNFPHPTAVHRALTQQFEAVQVLELDYYWAAVARRRGPDWSGVGQG
jgi:SAM-dependent methyltransferase